MVVDRDSTEIVFGHVELEVRVSREGFEDSNGLSCYFGA